MVTRSVKLIVALGGIVVLIIVFIWLFTTPNRLAETSLPTPLPSELESLAEPTPEIAGCQLDHLPSIEIKHTTTNLSLAHASSTATRVQGLSECSSLSEKQGMYFSFEQPQPVAFWMKDMQIPIDIIWVADNTIVGIEKAVPAPSPGTLTSALPQYPSPQAIEAVIEIGAGKADEYGFKVGDKIEVQI